MSRTSFAHGPAPMIVGVIRQRTPRAAIAEIKNGEVSGARGFDLHLDALDEEFRDEKSIRSIVESTDRPILALNYKNGYDGPLTMTEEQRVETLMTAVEAGASAIDIQGYTFCPEAAEGFLDAEYLPESLRSLAGKNPREVTFNPEVVDRQKRLIETVHEKGAEVLISMHFGVPLSTDELIALARYAHDEKGADIVKMVTPCANERELADVLSATLAMHEQLDFPFSYHGAGKAGKRSRMICPMFGSYLMFCNVRYGEASNFEQLPLGPMTEAYRLMGQL